MADDNLERKTLHKRLRREVGKDISDFGMIANGDRVMVCISGGKDSLTMLDILQSLSEHAPINFDIVAINLDQKQPGFPEDVLPDYFETVGVPYHIIEEDTYSLVTNMVEEGKPIADGAPDSAEVFFISLLVRMVLTRLRWGITGPTLLRLCISTFFTVAR